MKEIQIIDVTLRDGGHMVDFDWPMEFAQEYYSLMTRLRGVELVELGYWKQTEKSENPFYNLNQDVVEEVTGGRGKRNVAVMVDYHYCSHELDDYPTNLQREIGLIRLTCRKDHLDDGLEFASALKKHTKLPVSFNIFNISNYNKREFTRVCRKVIKHNFDYIYTADTHGNLDFTVTLAKFFLNWEKLKTAGKKVGMHLHNHTGKAYFNYGICQYNPFIDSVDTSIRGMGKGAGNLQLEHVLPDKDAFKVLEFIHKYKDKFERPFDPYCTVTGRFSITDNYAKQAVQLGVSVGDFVEFCRTVAKIEKDSFNNQLLIDWKDKYLI